MKFFKYTQPLID